MEKFIKPVSSKSYKNIKITIGIDASRLRSGGAISHLIGILSNVNPSKYKIKKIHIWSYGALLNKLPERNWLIKHNPSALEGSVFSQLIWQARLLAHELNLFDCNILFSPDASTLCRFDPMVVLSQDMLSYEPGAMKYFGLGIARLRLLIILVVQNLAFRRAKGVIFLTKYASRVIQSSCGRLSSAICIPHGIDLAFKNLRSRMNWPINSDRPIRFVYVSNAEMYKHQWVVIQAISQLRLNGFSVQLTLIGGGKGKAQQLVNKAINKFDPNYRFVKQMDFIPHHKLPQILIDFDAFIFASSCENMPVTLLEAMIIGFPIACSNRGPMPEVLQDGGIYFDPEDLNSLVSALKMMIMSKNLRKKISSRAVKIAQQYNWARCADETFLYILNIFRSYNE